MGVETDLRLVAFTERAVAPLGTEPVGYIQILDFHFTLTRLYLHPQVLEAYRFTVMRDIVKQNTGVFLCRKVRVNECNNWYSIIPPEVTPVQFDGLVYMLRVVACGGKTIVTDEEVFHRE